MAPITECRDGHRYDICRGPIRGPKVSGPDSPSAGASADQRSQATAEATFLRDGWVMVVPSRMVVRHAQQVRGSRRE